MNERQALKDDEEKDWEWSRHKSLKENPDNLPVPRLEMRWEQLSDDGYIQRWSYCLIYRHTLGHLIAVPLGETRTQGGRGEPPIHAGKLQTPFRDGVHICNDTMQLGIPAFGICASVIVKLWMQDGKCAQEPWLGDSAAGRAAAEGSADGNGEAKSRAGSAGAEVSHGSAEKKL